MKITRCLPASNEFITNYKLDFWLIKIYFSFNFDVEQNISVSTTYRKMCWSVQICLFQCLAYIAYYSNALLYVSAMNVDIYKYIYVLYIQINTCTSILLMSILHAHISITHRNRSYMEATETWAYALASDGIPVGIPMMIHWTNSNYSFNRNKSKYPNHTLF